MGTALAIVAALFLVSMDASAQEEDGAGGTDSTASEDKGGDLVKDLNLRGAVSNRYRVRWGDGDDHDQDLYQHLRVSFGDESKQGLSGSFYGRLTEDLDGRGDQEEFFLFRSLTDSLGSATNGRMYTGYATLGFGEEALTKVRVGRQYLYAGDMFQTDAIDLELAPFENLGELTISGFVGMPSHIFEASPDGDIIAGASARMMPWEGGRTSFHYAYIQDDNRYYGQEENDLWTFAHDQRFGDNLGVLGTYQHLNGDPYRVSGSVETLFPEHDLLLTGNFMAMVTRQKELVFDLDQYYSAALDLAPYWVGGFSGAKGFGENVIVEAGADWRTLFNDDDEGEFNREHARVFTTLTLDGIPHETLSASFTGELWAGDDDTIGAMTFELEWKPTKELRFVAGSDFSLYKYDLLSESERQNATGFYLRTRWHPEGNWRFDATLRLEHDDFGTYGLFGTGLEFGF